MPPFCLSKTPTKQAVQHRFFFNEMQFNIASSSWVGCATPLDAAGCAAPPLVATRRCGILLASKTFSVNYLTITANGVSPRGLLPLCADALHCLLRWLLQDLSFLNHSQLSVPPHMRQCRQPRPDFSQRCEIQHCLIIMGRLYSTVRQSRLCSTATFSQGSEIQHCLVIMGGLCSTARHRRLCSTASRSHTPLRFIACINNFLCQFFNDLAKTSKSPITVRLIDTNKCED